MLLSFLMVSSPKSFSIIAVASNYCYADTKLAVCLVQTLSFDLGEGEVFNYFWKFPFRFPDSTNSKNYLLSAFLLLSIFLFVFCYCSLVKNNGLAWITLCRCFRVTSCVEWLLWPVPAQGLGRLLHPRFCSVDTPSLTLMSLPQRKLDIKTNSNFLFFDNFPACPRSPFRENISQ